MQYVRRCCCFTLIAICLAVSCANTKRTGPEARSLIDQGKTSEGIQVFERLAEEGDDQAMVQLGIVYHRGTVVKQDYTKAMDWFLRAYEQQNADAFVNLGVMHRDGQAVPENKKMAFCVFLTTHMCGLGSQTTQYRSNSCLRRLLAELPRDAIKDCLSNYTLGYITAYLEARGKMAGIPDRYKPSEENPALRDLGWFLDSELDALYGEPTEEERRAREERDRKRRAAYEALRHTLVFQIRFHDDTAKDYRSYEVITGSGMMSGPIQNKALLKKDEHVVFEGEAAIAADRHRYVTLENAKRESLVFGIDHPIKPFPCAWSQWQKAAYVLGNRMDSFALLHGSDPRSRIDALPAISPELRFKVVKD